MILLTTRLPSKLFFIIFNFFFLQLPLPAKSVRSLGLVAKDPLNLLQHVGCQLLQQGQGLDVILELLNLCRAQDHGADVGVRRRPRQGELRDGSAETLGDSAQLAHLLDLGLASLTLELLDGALKEGLVGREPRVLRDAIVVLAGQQATGEGRPDGGAVAVVLEQVGVLNLEPLAVESVVLGLLDDGGNEVVLFGETDGFRDLSGGPLRSAPVVGKVEVADDLGEALNDLEHGDGGVGTVGKDYVDVGGLQTLEGRLETLDDVLPAQAAGVGLLAARSEEDLGGEDVLVTGPVELLEGLAHLDFGRAIGVDLGRVKGLL